MTSQTISELRIAPESDGARGLAYRMAGYIKDADYIWRMVKREYGPRYLPSIETIRAMQADHQRKRDVFRAVSESLGGAGGYNPDNDNGEDWRPRPLFKVNTPRPRPAPLKPPEPIRPTQLAAARHEVILITVAQAFGMTRAGLCLRSRRRRNVTARSVAARLLRNEKWQNGGFRYSATQIARMLGMNDHSSVFHLLDVFGPYRRKYPEMKAAYNLVKRRLR